MLTLVPRELPAGEAAPGAGALGEGLHPVLERIYAARGIRAAEELRHTLDRLLPVGSLAGTDEAARLLLAHRARRVLVVGDYDADGATSSALMLRALRAWGFAAVDFLVPNRFEYGYGLTPEIVAIAAQQAPTLLVTVDNGVASHAGVDAARARGMDVLVTDHHLPPPTLPAANVIVNPNLEGSAFGSRALAGVGVAFYVLAALERLLRADGLMPGGAPRVAEWLDLVALGTVADVVPLDRNNRILVAQGLARIRAGRCVPAITALLSLGKRSVPQLVASDLGFAVGPRLNAAGRLTDMSIGIRCLLADEPTEALALASELDALNRQRREIESGMQSQALAAVRVLADPGSGVSRAGVCLYQPEWHQGVVGLVASRVKERLRRPVIAFAQADERTLRGSARSVAGVHVRDVLEAISTREPGLIEKFGGHAMAAGLTLPLAGLDRFARAFNAEVERALGGAGHLDAIETDGELEWGQIGLPLAEVLQSAGPWGSAFPEPLFQGTFTVRQAKVVGERHLKFQVVAPEGRGGFDAIAFNSVDPEARAPLPEGPRRLAYRLGANEWGGERRLQLLVEHLLPA